MKDMMGVEINLGDIVLYRRKQAAIAGRVIGILQYLRPKWNRTIHKVEEVEVKRLKVEVMILGYRSVVSLTNMNNVVVKP